MENNKQTSINIYHTVSIRNDLPKIPKYYKELPIQNSLSNDFWIKKLDPQKEYEIQYNIINGPCKSLFRNYVVSKRN